MWEDQPSEYIFSRVSFKLSVLVNFESRLEIVCGQLWYELLVHWSSHAILTRLSLPNELIRSKYRDDSVRIFMSKG